MNYAHVLKRRSRMMDFLEIVFVQPQAFRPVLSYCHSSSFENKGLCRWYNLPANYIFTNACVGLFTWVSRLCKHHV